MTLEQQDRTEQQRLAALNARVRQDLSYLNYPAANWSKPVSTSDGQLASDVVIIGGGMCGLVAWHALTRQGSPISGLWTAPQKVKRGPG